MSAASAAGKRVWAVGRDGADLDDAGDDGDPPQAMALLRKEGRWTRSRTPTWRGGSQLTDVDAFTAKVAFAVGSSAVRTERARPVVLRWDEGSWVPVAMPRFSDQVELKAVSVRGPSEVWIAGSTYGRLGNTYRTRAIVRRWDGRSWANLDPPDLPTDTLLNDIVAVGTDEAWAVGASDVPSPGTPRPLVWHRKDGTWRRARDAVSDPAELFGVAVEGKEVWAVGHTDKAGREDERPTSRRSLALRLVGRAMQPVDHPAVGYTGPSHEDTWGPSLASVTIVGDVVWAVGSSALDELDSIRTRTFALRGNKSGLEWMGTPNRDLGPGFRYANHLTGVVVQDAPSERMIIIGSSDSRSTELHSDGGAPRSPDPSKRWWEPLAASGTC